MVKAVSKEKSITKTKSAHLYQKGHVDRNVVKNATKMTKEQWSKHQAGMDEKWPLPKYMNGEKGAGTRYRPETYMQVTRWTKDTKIAYRPHAKAPGSKSHLRYEKYSKAKTVGEALKYGTYPEDWCWDYERGFIKVLGGHIRDEPLDLAKAEAKDITEVDKKIHTWYIKEIAKSVGMNPKELSETSGHSESPLMRGLRLVAQQEAKARLEAAESEGRMISDEDIEVVLRKWQFCQNPHRLNVMPKNKKWVFSDTLGLLRDRAGDIHLTSPTRRYPQVAEIICRWLTDRLPEEIKTFTFTSINVNCNYAASRHRDNGNFGPSLIKAFGSFSGGELQYWPEDAGSTLVGDVSNLDPKDSVSLDIGAGLALFNGNCGHSVKPFTGNRYSIVYFTGSCHAKAKPEDKKKLTRLGFKFPKVNEDPYALIRAPSKVAKNAKHDSTSSAKKLWRSWDNKELVYTAEKKGAQIKQYADTCKKNRVAPENKRTFYHSTWLAPAMKKLKRE
eukprot:gnl/MRDRNA2_/MRDRNA2_95225_c0_seq1.p1 gnl/MRDRNA2_/MRDRNA2_95225_c0~~gnl/MRDRNA2_/MRDRNA2_95225_c0_seq1.p1  ORF type:complete len:501 (+),score=95.76 gnl/MRDRNA2_/MRDRNA2_95225_c0_seq1:98-1600(+)